ncbi:MAG TPA: cation:proton antiporter [Burkholderiaceae bacterium]|nr:cation:proton antiporter [Burkholderiaceae bacterium]HPE01171.1 cation:proton antiporter [Burkholderiaceae bacterium]HRZ00277.1 cation:proton antiporter [Burkholderiaceae bacterium]
MSSGLHTLLLLLAATVLGVLAFRRLGLPPLLAYLVIGILVGPHAAGLVPDTREARYLAEFGVVFLMFSIGLEFSLAKLRSMRRIVLGLGGAQVLLTIALTLALGWLIGPWLGLSLQAAFVLGGALAMSSTAIIMKMLAERLELESEHGKRIVGVLLFQDLAVVPLLVIIPALASPPEEMTRTLGLAFLKAAVVLGVLLVGGQKLMSGWFRTVARRRSHELFILNVLLVTLGLAWVTEEAGLSLALGAFVAGMLIAETEFRHQVEEDIKPFRDVLLGFFFITIGMLLDLRVVVGQFGWVLLALLVPVAFKLALIFGLTRAFGASVGTSLRTGLALCTAGEFGFVLLGLGSAGNLLEPRMLQIVLAAMLLSMMAAPLLVQHADRIVLRVSGAEWMQKSLELHRIAQRSMTTDHHVVVAGYGRTGQHLAKMLEQEGIGYVALDLDPDRVREAAAAGDSVVYGDAGRRETLVAAGVTRASALVVTYNDAHSALKLIHFAHEINPSLPIIVRTQDDADLDKLLAAGATEVVPEIFEGSLMLGSHALVLLGVPLSRVVRRVREARDSRYRLLRGYFHGADDPAESLDADAHDRLHSVPLAPGAKAVGREIGDLGLDEVGAEVTAVRRRGIRGADPHPGMKLLAGDVVVLRGVPEAIELAEQRLLQG